MPSSTPTIERSPGLLVHAGAVAVTVGGGVPRTGLLSDVVDEAARRLADAYQLPVTVRYNSDGRSGGAWLRLDKNDSISANCQVGVSAALATQDAINRMREPSDLDGIADLLQPGVTVSARVCSSVADDPHALPNATDGLSGSKVGNATFGQATFDEALLLDRVGDAVAFAVGHADPAHVAERNRRHRRNRKARVRRAFARVARRHDVSTGVIDALQALHADRFGGGTVSSRELGRALRKSGLADTYRKRIDDDAYFTPTERGARVLAELRAEVHAAA